MNDKSIFITYNPNNQEEELLAVRMHSVGAVNGFNMSLPDRYGQNTGLSVNTKSFIANSGWVIFFSFGTLSKTLKKEIEYAYSILKDKSRIIVIYHKNIGKNLTGNITDKFTSIYYNPITDNLETALGKIKEQIKLKEEKNKTNTLLAFLGVGLGLYALSEIFKSK